MALDLDGTLLDHSSAAAQAATAIDASLKLGHNDAASAWLAAAREHFPRYERGECSWEEQRRLRMRDFVSRSLTDRESDSLFLEYLTHYEAGWAMYPDAERLLSRIHDAAIPVAILTNGHLDQQRQKLRAIGWDYPSRVIASSSVGAAKPSPKFFMAAAHAASVPTSRILMIGDDAARDWDGAVHAGYHAAHLDRSLTHLRSPSIHSLDHVQIR